MSQILTDLKNMGGEKSITCCEERTGQNEVPCHGNCLINKDFTIFTDQWFNE